jgi:hypothetical protein
LCESFWRMYLDIENWWGGTCGGRCWGGHDVFTLCQTDRSGAFSQRNNSPVKSTISPSLTYMPYPSTEYKSILLPHPIPSILPCPHLDHNPFSHPPSDVRGSVIKRLLSLRYYTATHTTLPSNPISPPSDQITQTHNPPTSPY